MNIVILTLLLVVVNDLVLMILFTLDPDISNQPGQVVIWSNLAMCIPIWGRICLPKVKEGRF